MIRKLKPIQARALIAARRPNGLFYSYQNGIYTGIDNSAGHAWAENFTSLHKCKEWLRSPSGKAQPVEPEEAG